jgi:hypothetical protein
MMFLKKSTASQEILLGTFLDSTDGVTPETALTIANTDIKLFKAGATAEADKNSGGATHIAAGRYYAVLDATDTDTTGLLEINISVAGALPVRRSYTVLAAAVYDALVDGVATLGVNILRIDSDLSAATYLRENARRAVPVTFSAGGTTTTAVINTVDGSAASSTTDIYKNRVLIFSAPAAVKDQACTILSYNGATNTATISASVAAIGATAVAVML